MKHLLRPRTVLCLLCGLLLASLGCSAKAKLERHLNNANKAFQKGNYDQAEIEYMLALRSAPNNITALCQLGIIYAEEGVNLRAFEFLQKAQAMSPTNTNVLLRRALLLQSVARRYEMALGKSIDLLILRSDAREAAVKILELDPSHGEALQLVMGNSFGTNQISDAESRLEAYRQKNGENGQYHLAKAALLIQRGQGQAAETEAQMAVAADPKLYSAHLLLAEFSNAKSNYAVADKEFKMASTLAPLRSGNSLFYATFKLEQRQIEEARKIVQEVTTKAPDYLNAWGFLARMMLSEKKPDESLKLVDRILLRDPNNFDALELRARVYLTRKEPVKANQSLETLISSANDYAKRWQKWIISARTNTQAAVKYKNAEEERQAEQTRQQTDNALLRQLTLLFCPQLPASYIFAAGLQTNQSRAAEYLNRAIDLNPADAQPRILLTQLNLSRGMDTNATVKALADFVGLLEQRKMDVDKFRGHTSTLADSAARTFLLQYYQAAMALAELYADPRIGHFEEAITIYRRLLQTEPQDPGFHLGLGMVLERQKKEAQARSEFEQVLKLTPNSLDALAQLTILDIAATNQPAALKRLQVELDKLTVAMPPASTWREQNAELERKARTARLQYLQGFVYSSTTNTLDQAETLLRKSLESDINYSPAYRLLARIYLRKRDLESTVKQLLALLKIQPQDVVASLLLADVYRNMKPPQYDQARQVYESILSKQPGLVEVLNNLAFLYCDNLNQLDKAYEVARKARELAQDNPYVADTLGWILYRRGDYAQALPLIQESFGKLSQYPQILPEIQYHLGMTYYMFGQSDPARSALQQAVASNVEFPGKDEARARLASLQGAANKPATEVIADLEKMVKANAKDFVSLIRLGQLYEQQNQAQKASDIYEQAVRANPQALTPLLALARLNSGPLKNPTKAMDYANKAYLVEPANIQVLHLLGQLEFQSANYIRSYNLLYDSQRSQPGNGQIAYDFAWAAYSLGRIEEAKQGLQSAQATADQPVLANAAKRFLFLLGCYDNPQMSPNVEAQVNDGLKADANDVPALMVRGRLEAERGMVKEATQDFEKVLTRFPQFSPAQRVLAIIYSNDPAREKNALDLALKARESMPNDAVLAKTLGKIYHNRKEYQRALLPLQDCLRGTPSDAEALYYLGSSYFQLKDKAKAKTALQQALDAKLSGKLAEEAKRLLAP